ncbi:MAG: hypothetical protein GC192_10285 [Bacteroidetes bacterium]|nr:hypothetical protein [Bacteroidota bacterium]
MKTIQLIFLFIFCLLTKGCSSDNWEYEVCGKHLEYKLGLQKKFELPFLYDYLEGLNCAASQHKPVLVVFTVYACVGYDVFAKDLLKSKKVREILKNDFVTVLLHVDDKNNLNESEVDILERYGKAGIEFDTSRRFETIGHLNSAVQTSVFKNNSQVFFGLVNSKGQNLIQPFSYNRKDPEYFISKLILALESWSEQVK